MMSIYKDRITEAAKAHFEETVQLIDTLVSIPSVLGKAEEGMPYGRECRRAIDTAGDILRRDGFVVKEFEGHAVTASFDTGEAQLGILAHLDVVPEGEGWTVPPFALTRSEGKLLGRGTIDDKGPAAAVIAAMRIVRELGIPLKKNVRLILGSNEENGSTDMEYYSSREAFPPMLFTPDGSYPVINIEKGMIRYDMVCDMPGGERMLLEAGGGEVYNAVPDSAYAVIRGVDENEVLGYINCQTCSNRSECTTGEHYGGAVLNVINNGDNTLRITSEGKRVHASTPDGGINAVTGLIRLLSRLGLDIPHTLTGLSEKFPCSDTSGGAAGIAVSDEKSGGLTLVLSRFDCDGKTLRAGFDLRFPVCAKGEDIASALDRIAADIGMTGERVIVSEPHYADENSEFVRTLLDVYEDVTGEKGRCLAIGGGTYVHDTENGVAFGAEHSDRDNHMHGADEFITEEELLEDIIMYAEAIVRLCC
ncbi:MAG: Sapep family Mn(2+)-dependent dipeptidase [Huintestinicola sp.]